MMQIAGYGDTVFDALHSHDAAHDDDADDADDDADDDGDVETLVISVTKEVQYSDENKNANCRKIRKRELKSVL